MSFETAQKYLASLGMEDRIRQFSVSSATVELAAQAVGCEPARIAKTLSFLIGDSCILIVTAGDQKIDNSKYKAQFHTKAKMPDFNQVENVTGHAAGGVCPFGIHDGVQVYLDISLKRFDEIYPAAGSNNSAVLLSPEELAQCAEHFAGWIDVCKSIG
ncbi:MAG: YbaK/EbsC family protein [Massiliimalia sp.]|jgi:prolyl-tRNA editing enzyme YbaK/EbsC (Cys-tRNA(Pro) deacylase)